MIDAGGEGALPRASRPGGRSGEPVHLLPSDLVDQIAAGEVVERPASVVKELVENALDAEAQRVRVEIRGGGAELVAVTDDGVGMGPDDARLALERHATSKIASGADLARIGTFGFRGEALPAIASVSRLRLRTRARGATTGSELRVEAGKLVDARAAGGPEGTRVEVADLFVCVPARRKFLKSPTTEWGHVAEWLGRAALALPAVHFDVQRDERAAVSWPAVADPLERVAAVLSDREAEGLVAVAAAEGALRVHGFVSRPESHRPTGAGLHLYVNGRPVRDRLLRHALLDVYRDVLPRGRFPTALLFVELPPRAVDVNVHPAKWEVRFAEPGPVHRLVSRALREALASRRWIGGGGPSALPPERTASGAGAAPVPATAAHGSTQTAPPPPVSDWIFAGSPRGEARERESVGPGAGEPLRFAALRLLGQVLATYLVAETPDGLLLVDQHAAHERVLYERLRASLRSAGVARQPLLLTETVELSPDRVARIEAAQEALGALGFEVEPFGERSVAVRAIPALLSGRDPQALVRGLADELVEGAAGGAAPDALRQPAVADALFASMACHAARRAGERLDPHEQAALLEALDSIPWAPTCPHGRPVAVPIGRGELERRFARTYSF